MSLIEKLDEVLGFIGHATAGEWVGISGGKIPHEMGGQSVIGVAIGPEPYRTVCVTGPDGDRDSLKDARAILAAVNLLRDHGPAIRQAMIDAERYAWLRACDTDGEDAVMLRMSDFGCDELLSGEELDAAIDAARATGEGEHQNG